MIIAIKTIFDIQFPELALTAMMEKLCSKHSYPWVFMAHAFGISWLYWLPAGLLNQGADAFPVSLLIVTAITFIIVWGPETLTRRQENPS